MRETPKTLLQCDFDGTITEADISFKMMDAYATGDWRQLFQEYMEGKISVGHFNKKAFAMVKANKESLLAVARGNMRLRPGFHELLALCRRKGFRFVIVSNGLDFYIAEILRRIGEQDIQFFAAQTRFQPEGLKVQYIGPDGSYVDNAFKETYVDLFLGQGYRIIYLGNGDSDLSPARKCHHVFATGTLLTRCEQTNLACTPFNDFNEVIEVLEHQ